MALVLRKAVLPRNVTLLKCIKGRSLATAASKKNPAALSTGFPCRSLKDELKMRPLSGVKFERSERLPPARGRRTRCGNLTIRLCVSCPELVPASRTRIIVHLRHLSPPRTRPAYDPAHHKSNIPAISGNPLIPSEVLQIPSLNAVAKRTYATSCGCGCPCPFPCGPCGNNCGCNCLPPPCNTPPRCVQYMTGYYYYPYGFWFCGPYHVSGTCAPVGPGGCGPCGPPCTKCGPCGPCGPCPKCCGPVCVCPAATAFVSAQNTNAIQKPLSKPDAVPSDKTMQFPIPSPPAAQPSRSGISKYFPFSTSTGPGTSNTGRKYYRKQSTIGTLVCPYSTQASSHLERDKSYSTPIANKSLNSRMRRNISTSKFHHYILALDCVLPNRIDAETKRKIAPYFRNPMSNIRPKRYTYCNDGQKLREAQHRPNDFECSPPNKNHFNFKDSGFKAYES